MPIVLGAENSVSLICFPSPNFPFYSLFIISIAASMAPRKSKPSPEPWKKGLHPNPIDLPARDLDVYIMDQHPEIKKLPASQGKIYVIPLDLSPSVMKKMWEKAAKEAKKPDTLLKAGKENELRDLGEYHSNHSFLPLTLLPGYLKLEEGDFLLLRDKKNEGNPKKDMVYASRADM